VPYLGLPDGKIADVVDGGDGKHQFLILHLRNYGNSTAKDTIVEVWAPVVKLGEYVIQKIGPFYKFDPTKPHRQGFPVPPGLPFTATSEISNEDWHLVNTAEPDGTDEATLHVFGRISYTDRFGSRVCQSFSLMYDPRQRFSLSAEAQDICDGTPSKATLYSVKVGPKKPTRVWPPSVKPRIIED
jgi:hypothetical protein